MKSGIFARMSDEEGGCRIKSDKKNGTCGEVWSNE